MKDTTERSNIKLRNENLSVQISKIIFSEIQSGQLSTGDRLPSEMVLAEKYGVSRTILREAIASLKNEDILEAKPGRGLIVKDPRKRQAFRFSDVFSSVSMDEINYFYEMRAALESEASELAALRRSNEDMQAILAAYRGMEEAVEQNALGAIEHDNYNIAIAKASHNPILIEFLSFTRAKLHDLAQELRIKTMLSPERAHTVLDEHMVIVKCIAGRDPEGARAAVLQHLKNAADRAGIKIYNS